MPVVLITGASRGIGAALAGVFSERYGEKARVALVARSQGDLDRVATSCRAFRSDARTFQCDVTDPEAVAEMADGVLETFGTPDVLINNAGLYEPATLSETDFDTFRRQVDVNLTSAFLVTKAFLPGMQERGSGDLFYMVSVAALKGYSGGAGYCAAKHGLLGLARVVREETKEAGLRVVSVIPGATRTASWDGTDLPDSRFINPDDVARSVLAAHELSDRAVVEELLIRPQKGDI